MRRSSGKPYAVVLLLLIFATLVSACSPFWAQPGSPSGTHASTPTATEVVTCPTWQVTGGSIPPPPPPGAPALAVAAYNAGLVLNTPRPVRDLYTIASRLNPKGSISSFCGKLAHYTAERVGQRRTFYIINSNQIGYRSITAKLLYATPHVYMYVQDGAHVDVQALAQAADRFETSTYATDRHYFGNQWPTGPDGDPHITVLNVTGVGAGGYFSSEDEYPRSIYPYSNQRQMIVENLDSAQPGEAYYDATLAHEFQHMIHWYLHPADPSWTNEGMSVLAQRLNNFSTGGVDIAFLQNPQTMLGGWTDDDMANVPRYGAGYLFMAYYLQHFDRTGTLNALLNDPLQVPLNFDHELQAQGFSQRFNDVFADWALANVLDDPSIADGLYAYSAINGLKIQIQHQVTQYPYADGTPVQPAVADQYATEYYDFQPPDGASHTLTISLAGQPTVGLLDNQPFNGAPAEWWSNSANDMDSTLTRAFDLTSLAGKPVTLTFDAWYNLEPDSDYVYVEASTDGGKTWKTLPATTSSTTNPNGANYGYGITGLSGGGSSPSWIPETVDLSGYAGRHVLVRFECITDDAVHLPGFALDNLQIAQLGYHDNVSTDGGWSANGWLRTDNVLPEQYIVQAVTYASNSSTPEIRRILVEAPSSTARLTIPGFGTQVREVLLAVSAIAPGTTTPADYVLSVAAD